MKSRTDLLTIGWVHRWAHWRGALPLLQVPVMLVTIAIVLLGFFDIQDPAQNLATQLTWGFWWPAVVLTSVLVGRFWCTACPFGVINEKVAVWTKSRRLFPRKLRNLWIATFLFAALTWVHEEFGIIRSPRLTAALIVSFALAALVTGLIYQRRSYCRYLCPITGLQSLYSMIAPFEIRAVDRVACSPDCHQSCYRGNETAPGCPTFEFPMSLDRNTHCTFCFACVKTCPKNNLAFRVRSFGADLWSSARRSLDEAYLALVLIGVTTAVTAQTLNVWPDWISPLAARISQLSGAPAAATRIAEAGLFSLFSLLVVPFLGYMAATAAAAASGSESASTRKLVVRFGAAFIPIGIAMHLAHNAAYLLLQVRAIAPAASRLTSLFGTSAAALADSSTGPLINPETVHILQTVILVLGLLLSIGSCVKLAAKSLPAESYGKVLLPFAVLAVLFTLVNLYMLNQPMGLSRGM